MLLNVLIPLAIFGATLGASYFCRGLGAWELIVSCAIAVIASVATQAATSTGLFSAPAMSARLPAKPRGQTEHSKTAGDAITAEASEHRELIKELSDHSRLPSLDADLLRQAFARDHSVARDEAIMAGILATAVENGNNRIIAVVVQANPQLAFKEFSEQQLQGSLLFELLQRRNVEGVAYLLEHFPTVANQRGPNGQTPLHAAVSSRNCELIALVSEKCPQLLLEKNADGRTALEVVIESDEAWRTSAVTPIAEYLLERNPRLAVERNRDGKTMGDRLREAKFVRAKDPAAVDEVRKLLDEAAKKVAVSGATNLVTPEASAAFAQNGATDFDSGRSFSPSLGLPCSRTVKGRQV